LRKAHEGIKFHYKQEIRTESTPTLPSQIFLLFLPA